jgi:CheY-like chemotaxis protein
MNLAVNARDAMPKGGTLTITADTTFVDQAFCALHSRARTGSFVRIRVRDTGTGMSDEVKQHLFEPFFTTKPAGKGTGLGLAMVFGAIQQNQGFILIDSELGRGSSFDLYFPRLPGKAPITAAPEAKTGVPTGSERILLVEDDASVRQLSERVLNEHGYRVVACASGKEAIAASKSADVPLDLLIADVILPDIDGRAVATEVVKHWPALRVLYCSGHIGEVIAHHGVVEEGLFFLPKPFNAEDLVRKVRAVLDRTAFASG